ncbi:helix-turn-helix domain-containing protein [Granulicatella sp. 19428wC4_WM01]|nr:helix-turn-helix domain-containing protein [Granulicatella sp. 19428wC4_WM01]MBF0779853.1 helix-turn-helix transcriptional regulator [Granulicatella sp. 19428wC4_WM01]TFU96057.1 transcriptional regulator [Granulicatella sp. WM01]
MKDIFDYEIEHAPQNQCICPKYEKIINILGKRWNGLIIEVLHQKDCRFSELAREIEGVSDRMLTERLRELEHEQIIEKNVMHEGKIISTYRLTEKGKALGLAMQPLKSWAGQWIGIDE